MTSWASMICCVRCLACSILVRRLGIDFQDLVCRGKLHALGRSLATAGAARAGASAELLTANAQHRLHVREFQSRNVEQFGHPLHGDARRPLHVHTFE